MKYRLTIDGKTYEVDLEPIEPEGQRSPHAALPAAVPRSPFPPAATAPASGPPVDEGKVCRSPVTGVVVKMSAQTGQSIQINDELMVLEAMKMETTIASPVPGKIARVNVAVGDSVQSGQVVVEFE